MVILLAVHLFDLHVAIGWHEALYFQLLARLYSVVSCLLHSDKLDSGINTLSLPRIRDNFNMEDIGEPATISTETVILDNQTNLIGSDTKSRTDRK